eukprot:11057464-Lingulodinium_polyedra.AAC.1
MAVTASFDAAFTAYARAYAQCSEVDEGRLSFFVGGVPAFHADTPQDHACQRGSMLIEASHPL